MLRREEGGLSAPLDSGGWTLACHVSHGSFEHSLCANQSLPLEHCVCWPIVPNTCLLFSHGIPFVRPPSPVFETFVAKARLKLAM